MINALKSLVGSIQPEQSANKTIIVARREADSWGWLPALSLISAVGVFLLALAYNAARFAVQGADVLFWFGLLVIILPTARRLLSAKPTRRERIALVIVLGMALYFAKFLQYPLYFAYSDEFAHWRTVLDIAASGHLFRENPLLPISSFYPGLEIAASAISSLTGLSVFGSGIVLLSVVRLVFVLALYLFYEHVIKSARVAGLATMLYMANPHFLLFEAQFGYESLALPLAIFVLFVLVLRCYVPVSRQRGLTLAMCLGLGAVVITHHITSYLLVALLFLWTVISFLQTRNLKEQAVPGGAALLGLVLSIAWLTYTGNVALDYLSPHLTSATFQVGQIFSGGMAPRQLFLNGAGFVTPLWERLMAFASVALILLGLPFGLFQIWRYHRANALALALTGGALAYPVSQVLRLTAAGAESADRATEFLFLGIAFVLAVGATELWLSRTPGWRRSVMIMGAVAVIFVGQVIAGSPPWFRMPGPYLVSADPRSVEPEGMTAAQWVDLYLGTGQAIASDRINTLLMATYGDEPASLVGAGVFNVTVVPVFISLQFSPTEEAILRQNRIHYVVVDRRLSTSLPWVGTYFGQSLPWRSSQPIAPVALMKFDDLKNVSRLFDSGDIIIYDVDEITNPPLT
jgi:hypothetical protein